MHGIAPLAAALAAQPPALPRSGLRNRQWASGARAQNHYTHPETAIGPYRLHLPKTLAKNARNQHGHKAWQAAIVLASNT